MFVLADAVTQATWALVVATALLVIATAIPAGASLVAFLRERPRRAAEVVPDMHMLRGRLNRQIGEFSHRGDISAGVLVGYVDDNGELLEILGGVIELAPRQGMKFTNELYIVRHLLSLARYEMVDAVDSASGDDDEFAMVRQSDLSRALNLYVAAKTSLIAAEAELPRRARSIDGESFWDRFSRLSNEREHGAQQQIMQERGH